MFEGSQQSWKYPTIGIILVDGVTVGVLVLVGVNDGVLDGGGGGHAPSIQKSPIVILTIGSSDNGDLPQNNKIVSGGIIVSTKIPSQFIKDIVCSNVSGLLNSRQLQLTIIVGVMVGVRVGVTDGIGQSQTWRHEHPEESTNSTTT